MAAVAAAADFLDRRRLLPLFLLWSSSELNERRKETKLCSSAPNDGLGRLSLARSLTHLLALNLNLKYQFVLVKHILRYFPRDWMTNTRLLGALFVCISVVCLHLKALPINKKKTLSPFSLSISTLSFLLCTFLVYTLLTALYIVNGKWNFVWM